VCTQAVEAKISKVIVTEYLRGYVLRGIERSKLQEKA